MAQAASTYIGRIKGKKTYSGVNALAPWSHFDSGRTIKGTGQSPIEYLSGQFDQYFSSATKDYDADDLKALIGIMDLSDNLEEYSTKYKNWQEITDVPTLKAILAMSLQDTVGDLWNKHGNEYASKLNSAINRYEDFNDTVQALKAKNFSDTQINQFLSSSKIKSNQDYSDLADTISSASASDLAGYGVTDDPTVPNSFSVTAADVAEGQAETPLEQAEDAVNNATFGDATNPDGLTAVSGTTDQFTDADGKTVYLGSDGKYRYGDGKEYISPGQSTVATEIADDQASANAAEDVVDAAVQQSAEGAQGASDINIAYTGGAVNEGVANALGWNRSVLEDGTVQFTDPRTDSVYTLGDDGALTDTSGNEAYTEGMLNFQENDFAGAFQDTVNDYLFGSSINTSNFADYGFTFDEAAGTYTGPNGQTYTVDGSGTLQDVDGNALRNQGFLGYQQDLEAAGEQYTSDMTSLRGEYAQAYSDYDAELRPRMGQLDSNIAALNQVAQDANDTNYYNRLKNLYFAEAQEQIDRSARGSQDTLNSTYANAGLDPSSPAYTAAIMDLEQKRADASRSANRQAMLDSYTMGSNMLANRQGALNSAQAGITTGINALGSLYDVRISGLNVDKDMISAIYSGKQNQAAVGISGLNTIAQQQQSGINAERDQFNTNLNLRTGLNAGTIDAANAAATTGLNADANATNDYWTGMGWLQTLIDKDFDWKATGAALQTQFPDFDFSTLDPKLQAQLGINS